jgi:DNA-binding GntR family transcriptional regulator
LEKTSLREQALTALQISRGTLREAMRQLQQEGLISAAAR